MNGSGCGKVDSMVTSDNRGPRFESGHRQFLLNIYCYLEIKKLFKILYRVRQIPVIFNFLFNFTIH